jgi:hypothetical protein
VTLSLFFQDRHSFESFPASFLASTHIRAFFQFQEVSRTQNFIVRSNAHKHRTVVMSDLAVPPLLLLPIMFPLILFTPELVANQHVIGIHNTYATEMGFLDSASTNSSSLSFTNPPNDEDQLFFQPMWNYLITNHRSTVSHILFPAVLGLTAFFLSCCYFTVKDLNHDLRTKTQPDKFPTIKDMFEAAIPQIVIYVVANSISWVYFPQYIQVICTVCLFFDINSF